MLNIKTGLLVTCLTLSASTMAATNINAVLQGIAGADKQSAQEAAATKQSFQNNRQNMSNTVKSFQFQGATPTVTQAPAAQQPQQATTQQKPVQQAPQKPIQYTTPANKDSQQQATKPKPNDAPTGFSDGNSDEQSSGWTYGF